MNQWVQGDTDGPFGLVSLNITFGPEVLIVVGPLVYKLKLLY